ncbi:MAG: CvpA family protein [Chitinophagales bacterium]|nr:CvpA family protein [Bacteroidota bacterium]
MFIDIAFIVTLLYGFYLGITTNFYKNTVYRLKVVVALIAALNGSHVASSFISKNSSLSGDYAMVVAFIVLFVGIMMLFTFLNSLLLSLSKEMGVDLAYRGTGTIVWFLLISFGFSAFLHLGEQSDIITPMATASSGVYPYLQPFYDFISCRLSGVVPAFTQLIHAVLAMLGDLLNTIQHASCNSCGDTTIAGK